MYLFLLPHTTVERRSLKLGIHFNLKAASLRLSRYHLISATITHRTLLYTIKDIYTSRQLHPKISNKMSQDKLSPRRQFTDRKISQQKNFSGLLSKVYHTEVINFTTLASFFSIFPPHQSPNFYHSPRPLFHYFYHCK